MADFVEDETIMVCQEIGKGATAPIAGADVALCDFCHQGVWVAPTGMKMLTEMPGLRKMCGICFVKHIEEHGKENVQITPLTKEQSEEVIEEIKRKYFGKQS